MGTYIFLTAVFVEVVFAVFCIITKSNHQKVRRIIRISILIGFILLVALTVIEWSSRYYSLAVILLILAGIETIGLIRNKQKKREYKATRVVIKTIGIFMILLAATLPSIIFPQHKIINTTGKYQVGSVTYTYVDTKRIETYTDKGGDRKLNVEMWYPKNADGRYPLIVFSHGSLGQ